MGKKGYATTDAGRLRCPVLQIDTRLCWTMLNTLAVALSCASANEGACRRCELAYAIANRPDASSPSAPVQLSQKVLSDTPSNRTTSHASYQRRSEEHTSELQSRQYLVCRLLLEKKKKK